MSTVCVTLAHGLEEIEAVTIIDVLRRADIEVIAAGVNGKTITGAHQIKIESDCPIEKINTNDIDMIVLPGGLEGTNTLKNSEIVQRLIQEMDNKGKLIGAICAAPLALDSANVIKSKFTCYPSIEQEIKNAQYTEKEKVVIDQNIMTSRGPGTAMNFALEIVKRLKGADAYSELKSALLVEQ